MNTRLKSFLQHYAPTHLHDPFGLVLRLLHSENPAARFALDLAALGVVSTPFDLALQLAERRRYRQAVPPKHPLIFVCGASRTGTTLVSQVLIKHLPVCYLSNFTALFPRSPVSATRLFQRFLSHKQIDYTSYYGKSTHLSGPNEGFYLWNRWMKKDKWAVKSIFDPHTSDALVRFWGAYQAVFDAPLVAKYNNLNVCASDVAQVLDTAYFICMTRDPAYLAQSLLQARQAIQGDMSVRYGVDDPSKDDDDTTDIVEDVCHQVLFHERTIQQQQRVCPERFWIVKYEDFCQQPASLVQRVAQDILHTSLSSSTLTHNLPPFTSTNHLTLDPELFTRIQQTFFRLRQSGFSQVA